MVQHTASGAGAPTSPPPSIGAHYTDTSSGDQYLAKGVLSPSDWVLQGGAGGKKVVDLPEGVTSLTLAHADTFLANLGGGEVAIPARSSVNFPIGTEIEIGQIGVNSVTLVAAEGVEILHKQTRLLETNGRGTMIRLKNVGQDTWLATGDLVPDEYLSGIAWEAAGPIDGSTPQYVCAPVGLGTAVVGGSSGLAWTEDGDSYTSGLSGVDVKGLVYAPGAGKFFALVGPEAPVTAGFRIMSSTTGKDWIEAAVVGVATEAQGYGLAWSESLGRLVVCGYAGAPAFWSSADGVSWSPADALPGGPPAWGVMFSNVHGKFIALVGSPDLGTLESQDGETWSAGVADVGIGYSGTTRFAEDPGTGNILLTTGDNQYARSVDGGLTWSVRSIGFPPNITQLAVNSFEWAPGAGVILASGASHSRIAFSPDGGDSWVETTPVDTGSNYNNWAGEFTDLNVFLAFASGSGFKGTPVTSPVE